MKSFWNPAAYCGAPLPTHFLTASCATSPFGAAMRMYAGIGVPIVLASPRRNRVTWYRYARGVTSGSSSADRLPVPIRLLSAAYQDATSCGPL